MNAVAKRSNVMLPQKRVRSHVRIAGDPPSSASSAEFPRSVVQVRVISKNWPIEYIISKGSWQVRETLIHFPNFWEVAGASRQISSHPPQNTMRIAGSDHILAYQVPISVRLIRHDREIGVQTQDQFSLTKRHRTVPRQRRTPPTD